MTTDEVKKYLWQARKFDNRLKREQRNLDKLRSAIEYRSPSFDGVGGHGGGDKMSAAVAKIVERAQRVDELAVLYAQKYEEIERTIRAVGDDVLEEVLELRYLQYMKWEDITGKMGYKDTRWVQRLHGRALKIISKKISRTIESHV